MQGPSLSILYVAYPLLTVSEDSAGGAEQMLLTLEREMAAAGHRTTVAASEGSHVSGELLATGAAVHAPDDYERREREHCDRILAHLRRHRQRYDLIHDKSGSLWRHAYLSPMPMLATLHLPRSFYQADWFRHLSPNLHFNCVSQAQARTFAGLPNLLGLVQNGIPLDGFDVAPAKQDYVLWLGRICEEKGPHLAIEAAQRAGVRLVLAGQVYPFTYHQQYFEREIQPHISERVQFIDSPTRAAKIDLLRHARAVMLTSTAQETSSLVAMEAMACGTPVVALRTGAFPEIVADGETGFVVDSVEEMAEALQRVAQIAPITCRQRVEQGFTAQRMAGEYAALYRQLLEDAGEQSAA